VKSAPRSFPTRLVAASLLGAVVVTDMGTPIIRTVRDAVAANRVVLGMLPQFSLGDEGVEIQWSLASAKLAQVWPWIGPVNAQYNARAVRNIRQKELSPPQPRQIAQRKQSHRAQKIASMNEPTQIL